MTNIFQSLLLLIAQASKNQLARQIKYLKVENEILRSKLPARIPNTNAFIERFIQSIGQDCLDRFVIIGAQHTNHLCQEYLKYYHHERPHQSLNNEPIIKPKIRGRPKAEPEVALPLSQLRCKERLGGLLKSYSRAA